LIIILASYNKKKRKGNEKIDMASLKTESTETEIPSNTDKVRDLISNGLKRAEEAVARDMAYQFEEALAAYLEVVMILDGILETEQIDNFKIYNNGKGLPFSLTGNGNSNSVDGGGIPTPMSGVSTVNSAGIVESSFTPIVRGGGWDTSNNTSMDFPDSNHSSKKNVHKLEGGENQLNPEAIRKLLSIKDMYSARGKNFCLFF